MFKHYTELLTDSVIRYYPNQDLAYELLEQFTNVNKEYTVLYDGSDRAIRNIFQVYVTPGSRVITTDPSFQMYGVYADMYQANLCTVCYTTTDFPFADVLAAIDSNTNLVIISNPSSPIGTVISNEQLLCLLAHCEQHNCVLAVDEAYIEFSTAQSLADLATTHPNLIVIRTLSKAAGSAGVRIGYTISDKYNKALLYKLRSMNDITGPSIAWLATLIEFKNEINTYVTNVIINRNDLIAKLREHNILCLPSETNFIHAKVNIENCSYKACNILGQDCIRISVPGDKNNLIKIINKIQTGSYYE
jgi:histidinol-phosphate aminotransferase